MDSILLGFQVIECQTGCCKSSIEIERQNILYGWIDKEGKEAQRIREQRESVKY